MEKLQNLQLMRAIAAVLVVWAHAIDVVGKRQQDAFQIAWGALENFGAVGVDVFFVISGFIVSLTAERSRSVTHFLVARLVRIWPPYLIATVVVFAVDPAARSLATLAWSAVFLQAPGLPEGMPTHPLGWSLMFEAAFYLMLAGAICWRTRRSIPERVLIIGSAAILVAGVCGFHQPMNIIGNPVIIEFLLGVVIGWVYRRRPELPTWVTSGLFVVGTVLLLSTAMYGFGSISEAPQTLDASLSWDRVRVWGIPSALLIASAVFRSNATSAAARPLVFLGDSSYSIYLFSFVALLLLDQGWEVWAPASPDVAIVLATSVAVVFGVICYVILERPLTSALRTRIEMHLAKA
ncbi:acyltransferase family protein [Stenotrophomonas maltophilia]|uniref:acyltransferase family protein n=1 Tax=Stenotrophomonas maltophilia TaxID=40324 RepID=UPI001F5308F2|nr:acyltransferase [Stenotrophomonas maltophilia]MCI1151988.1 acyltransferase [Stenotrophomonas maltophilia]